MLVYLQRIGWFVGLILIQVLILGHVHIYGYATPFFFIYFILSYNSGVSRSTLMLWAFFLGLTMDIFGDTLGINTSATVLIAFIREPLIRLVSLREIDGSFNPGVQTMGFSSYFRYVLISTFLFCTIVELLETFTFFNWQQLVWRIFADTVITLICVFCVEAIRRKKRGKEL